MAHIRKRKNKKGITYQANVRCKQKNIDIYKSFNRLSDAREWAIKKENEITENEYQKKDNITFFENALNDYMNKISINKAKLTYDREKTCSKSLLKFFNGFLLCDISPKLICQYRDKRLIDVSPYSVRLELTLLKQIYKIAQNEWGIIIDNPVNMVKFPSVPHGRENFLDKIQIKLLLDECKNSTNKKLYFYVFMILHSGMRPGEAAGLLKKDIKTNRKIIEVFKKGKKRHVPMTDSLLEKIPVMLSLEPKSEYVFLPQNVSEYFKNYPSQYFRCSFKHAIKRGKLNITIHDLRHTSASLLLMAGVDIRTLADILGHSSLNMVKRYTHLLDDYKISAINKINNIGD